MVKLGAVLGLALFAAGLFASVYFGLRHVHLSPIARTVTVNTTTPVRTITTK